MPNPAQAACAKAQHVHLSWSTKRRKRRNQSTPQTCSLLFTKEQGASLSWKWSKNLMVKTKQNKETSPKCSRHWRLEGSENAKCPSFRALRSRFESWDLGYWWLLYAIVNSVAILSSSMSVALLNMQAGCSHGKSENWQWPPLPTLSHFSLLGKIGFGLYWFFSTTAYPRTHRLCSLHCLAADFNILPTQNIWLNLWLSNPLWPALQIWKLIVSQLTEVVVQKCTCKSKSHSISQCTHLSRNKKKYAKDAMKATSFHL